MPVPFISVRKLVVTDRFSALWLRSFGSVRLRSLCKFRSGRLDSGQLHSVQSVLLSFVQFGTDSVRCGTILFSSDSELTSSVHFRFLSFVYARVYNALCYVRISECKIFVLHFTYITHAFTYARCDDHTCPCVCKVLYMYNVITSGGGEGWHLRS